MRRRWRSPPADIVQTWYSFAQREQPLRTITLGVSMASHASGAQRSAPKSGSGPGVGVLERGRGQESPILRSETLLFSRWRPFGASSD